LTRRRRRLLPKWVTEFKDRHGKYHLRFRRQGFESRYIHAEFGTEEFRIEYRDCLEKRVSVAVDRTAPGSIDDLIVRYYKGQEYTGGALTTRKKNYGILEAFRETHGKKSVDRIQFEHIDAIIAKKSATHPAAARNLRKQLKRLFAFAVKCRMRSDNPVDHTTPVKVRKDAGWKAWSESDVTKYQAHHGLGSMARLALEIMLWTGNRRGDALTLGPRHIQGDAFKLLNEKTGKTLVIPIAPALAKAIAAMPANDHETLITTSYGKAFSKDGFGNRMRKWCDEAGLPERTAHGLRKTISERMALSGAGNQGIKSVTGHSADSEVSLYTKGVDQERLARDTMAVLVAWELSNHKCLTGAEAPESDG